MKIAILPARGGSKRIPGKNIREFCGRPMLAYPVHAALVSGCFDRVIVSTDSEQIADVARTAGAEAPFLRPAALADEHTCTMAVVQHAIAWLDADGSGPSHVCCLYPTASLVRAEDLRRGLHALQNTGADYAVAVARYGFPIQRALRIDGRGRLGMFDGSQYTARSQDLEPAHHDAGQFYWGTAQAWREGRAVYSAAAVPVLIPTWRVQDIDTPDDWRRAELLYLALPSAERQS